MNTPSQNHKIKHWHPKKSSGKIKHFKLQKRRVKPRVTDVLHLLFNHVQHIHEKISDQRELHPPLQQAGSCCLSIQTFVFFKKPHTQISNLKSKVQASVATVAKVKSSVLECSTHHGDRFMLNPWEQRCRLKPLPFTASEQASSPNQAGTSQQEHPVKKEAMKEKHIMVTEVCVWRGHNSLNYYTELRSAYSPNGIISFFKKSSFKPIK